MRRFFLNLIQVGYVEFLYLEAFAPEALFVGLDFFSAQVLSILKHALVTGLFRVGANAAHFLLGFTLVRRTAGSRRC